MTNTLLTLPYSFFSVLHVCTYVEMMKNLQLSAGEASTSMMMHDYCTAEKKAGEREMEITSLRASEGNPSEALIGSVMEIEEEGALKISIQRVDATAY